MAFLTFLSDAPGSWLYIFVLLAALEAPAALALQQWWLLRRQDVSGQGTVMARLALASWALFGLLVAGLLATLLIPAGTPDALTILPPLDRATAAIGVLILIWALAFPAPAPIADVTFVGLAIFAVLSLGVAWVWWAQGVASGATFFNGSIDETAWVVVIGLLLAGGIWLLNWRRPSGWRAGLGLLGALLAAYAVHYLYPLARSNAAGVVRWAELVVVPLTMAVLYRRALAWPLSGAAGATATGMPPTARPLRTRPVWRQMAETLLVAAVVYFALEFATGRFRVEGPSMQPSLYTGQFVFADKLAYHLGNPQRGDIVVVLPNLPTDQDFIKRLMGLPGESVTVNNGGLWINGQLMTEPYITAPASYTGTWQLGLDQYFVMGDNRNNSTDSHVWGAVHRRAIAGKVLFVYWPLTQARFVPPTAFAAP
jgi:signal peptidase I